MADLKELVRAKCCKPHIYKDGARYHVHSYSLVTGKDGKDRGMAWCSEPFCEHNAWAVIRCIEIGRDPARIAHSVPLKNWLAAHSEPQP